MKCANGAIAVSSTDGNGTTFTATCTDPSTGTTFQPTLIFFFWNGVTTLDTVSATTFRRGFGVATGTTNRWAVADISVDASASADTASGQTADQCMIVVNAAEAIDGKVDIDAILSDGFRLIVDDQLPVSVTIHWFACNPTSAVTGTVTEPNGVTGNQDTTGLAFDPTGIAFGHAPIALVAENSLGDSRIMFGAATGSSNQAVWAGNSNNGEVTMVTRSYCTDADVIAAINTAGTGFAARAQFVAFLSGGFRLNWVATDNQRVVHYVAWAVSGSDQCIVAGGLTQTDTTTPIAMPGGSSLGTVKGGLVVSHCKAESAAGTLDADDEWSMGAFTSASSRSALCTMDDDGTNNAETSMASEGDQVYANLSTADAIQGLMDVSDMSAKTYIMDDADPVAAFFFNILFGEAAAAAGQPAIRRHGRLTRPVELGHEGVLVA